MSLKKWIVAFALGFVAFLVLPQQASAASGAEFTIRNVYSEEQTDPEAGFFAYQPIPDHDYTINTMVENLNRNETLDFEARLLTATTQDQGGISYLPAKTPRDKSLKLALPDMLKDQAVIQKFSIAPGQKQVLTYHVHTPKEPIKGTILGSVHVKRLNKSDTSKQMMALNNKFSMTIPVIFKGEMADTLLPELHLTKVQLQAVGGLPQLTATVHNSQPVMFGEIYLTTKLFKKGQDTPILTQRDKNLKMAPNSTMNYIMTTNNKTLAPGRYTLKMTVVSGAETFHLQKSFTIKATDEKEITKQLVKDNRHSGLFWLLLGVGLTLGIGLLIFLIRRRKNKA
ncbi:WxL protein host-binding domain-containing protein [Agrilactobacillus yilanensis]|uniref:WxL protein host-binding domain-containing protein n=1 Tax=Agrilactobacillus yilanensis TaxID=2485997 RepID=A0ABW4J868_9LACO|nr:DUF3324 domain-containing protein [Agrilactobacillus yilanensis]